jgi:hypothetical protein
VAPPNVTVEPAQVVVHSPPPAAAPEVHVTVEQPRAKPIRVTEDAEGNRIFAPVEDEPDE